MELTTSDRTTLFFETYGDPADRPLVLLHGLGADPSNLTVPDEFDRAILDFLEGSR